MLARHYVTLGAFAVLSLPIFSAGCSNDEKATPQAIFGEATFTQTSEPLDPDQKNCGESGDIFSVGKFGNPAFDPPIPSEPKKDGDSEQQGSVGFGCSVRSSGQDAFDISASLRLTGATGGNFVVTGNVKSVCDDANPCKGINATWSKNGGAGIIYNAHNDCVIRYTTPFQGVAAGRVWGEIECPKVTNDGAGVACKAVAQFRFENCDQ